MSDASFQSRLHSEEVIKVGDKHYRVRLARRGVHRYSPIGGAPNLTAVLFSWIRFLLKGDRGWVLTVHSLRLGMAIEPPELEETFPTRQQGAKRAEEVVKRLEAGTIHKERGQ
jgi:hypothetical protein